MSPPSFPPTVPCPGAPFPPRGPSGRFPRFIGTTGALRLPRRPSRRARFLARRYRLRPVFASARADAHRTSAGVLLTQTSRTGCCDGDGRISQVPGEPPACMPCSRPRRDLGARPVRRLGVAFRSWHGVGSRDRSLFRGSITRPAHSLSTLRRLGYPRTTQDSLPAGGHPCRTGFYPQGSSGRFPSDSLPHVISSPFSRLCLAHARLMKYPSVPPPTLSPPTLHRHAPALVSGVLHYLATPEGFGLRKHTAPILHRSAQAAASPLCACAHCTAMPNAAPLPRAARACQVDEVPQRPAAHAEPTDPAPPRPRARERGTSLPENHLGGSPFAEGLPSVLGETSCERRS